LVVRVAPVDEVEVEVDLRVRRQGAEELLDEVGVEASDPRAADLDPVVQVAAPARVDHRPRQCVVERRVRVAEALDPQVVAERVAQRPSERDADVLDEVVLVDMEVARRLDLETEAPVHRERVEHVVEEADAGGDPRRRAA
jgi:hypothetical protein